MSKRLGTLIAALSLVAVAEVHGASGPTKQPAPNPKPNPSPCPSWQQCPPVPPTCPPWRVCSPKPAPVPCGGTGQSPCRR
jgi:hypothetical protein